MRKLALSVSLIVGWAICASAQELPKIGFSVGAGFTTPTGNFGNNLDTGWNVDAGAGMYFTKELGVNLDAAYNTLGFNSTVLGNVGYHSGSDNIFSLTLNPIVHVTPHGPVDVYVTGGGGYYYVDQAFSSAGTTTFPGAPFFPYGPTAAGFSNSYSTNKPGIDAGIGVAFGHKWGGQFFAEARWDRIFLNNYHMDFLPVTFGFRR